MKKALLIILLVCATVHARAEGWQDVAEGLSQRAALEAAGAPLIVTKSKSGQQITWIYDSGGYIMFERGRVRFWCPPQSKKN